MDTCVHWFTVGLQNIIFYAQYNAFIFGRNKILPADIIIGIKRFKFGYSGFGPPPIVLKVYNEVFNDEEKIGYITAS
mgnify:CR=1 FL=1|tara:strand:+ start:445 stop:675 length:231 start_codon:yes stop_codon:yes gene_type:complete